MGGRETEDPTAPPRAGEEIDPRALSDWLRTALPEAGPLLGIEQFPAGHSNLTYLLRTEIGGELVLRRPPHGSRVRTAHDMGREYRMLSALHPVYEPAPRPLAYCAGETVLGAPFYLMERRRGLVIRKTLPEGLASRPELVRALSFALVDNLSRLHLLDPASAGLDGFGKPEGYVRRQIEGWSRRWRDAQTEPAPELDAIERWLAERIPGESGVAVIHNDYKLDNVMLDPDLTAPEATRIVAVLDWEMATVGDPLMDLGTSLAYWVELSDAPELVAQQFVPTASPGFPSREEFVARYRERSNRDTGSVVYYYAYGLFKLAVILQQIHRRWKEGLTHDARFGGLGAVVRALGRQGARVLAAGSISPRGK